MTSSPFRLPLLALTGLLILTAPSWAHKAHQHGVAKLDVAVEAGRISLRFESPLDNIVGFERAPRTDAERARAEAALKTLNEAGELFAIDPAAGCSLQRTEVHPGPLAGTGATAEPRGEHADLEAEYDYQCKDGARAGFVTVTRLFEAFPRLRSIEVQTATPKGQLKAQLRRPNGRVALAR